MRDVVHRKWFWIALALVLGLTLGVQYNALEDPYHIDDDVRQYFWMARYQNPELFPEDELIENVKGIRTVDLWGGRLLFNPQSPGFSLLYRFASCFVDFLTFNKVLPFLNVALAAFYLFGLALDVTRSAPQSAFITALFGLFVLGTSSKMSPLSGLERSFQFVLLLAFLYYFLRGSWVGVTLALGCQILFYGPTFVVSILAYISAVFGCRLLFQKRDERKPCWKPAGWSRSFFSKETLLPLFVSGLLGLLIFDLNVIHSSVSPIWDGFDANVSVWENPRYQAGGRIPIFPTFNSGFPYFLVIGYGGLFAELDDFYHLIPLFLVLVLIIVVKGFDAFRYPKLNALLFASLSTWLLCWITALLFGEFVLLYPFKYTNAPLSLWFFLVCSLNSEALLTHLIALWAIPRSRWRLGLAIIGVVILSFSVLLTDLQRALYARLIGSVPFVVGAIALLHGRILGGLKTVQRGQRVPKLVWGFYALFLLMVFLPHVKDDMMTVPDEQRSLLRYIATLPEDALLAGSPDILSNIPLFSQRSVFLSREISFVGRERVIDFFAAYYSEDKETIMDFCEKYGVDYMVVDLSEFTEEYMQEGEFFYAPYNAYIADITSNRADFFLSDVPIEERGFTGRSLFLWRCSARD
ncbi:MAG: hypothetical protein ACP5HM_07175 [Anaerolineae bacterium]